MAEKAGNAGSVPATSHTATTTKGNGALYFYLYYGLGVHWDHGEGPG